MDIQQLKYFTEVVKNKSYTKAAQELYITQPMLTRVIKQIELELDACLIERTSKSFKLTDSGECFFILAQELLQRHSDIYRYINDLKMLESGEIKISIPGVLLDIYFPKLLFEFNKRHPNINVSIIEEGSKKTTQTVLANKVDFGLVMLPVENSLSLEINTIIRDECQIIVNKHHRLANNNTVSLEEIKNEKIITFSETATLHDVFIAMCESNGFDPNIAYKSLMSGFIFEMTEFSNCIAVLPGPVVRRYITENLISIPMETKLPWHIAIINKQGRYKSFAAKRLINFMIEYFEALP